MLLQIATVLQQAANSRLSAGRGISAQMLARINSLGRGQTFDVDVVDSQGRLQPGGATVTLAGENGSFGAYIQLKGADWSYYCTGTTADGKYVAPHKIDKNGHVESDISNIPKIRLTNESVVNKILGTQNGRRRGYAGSYKMQTAADGSISVFYSGGRHQEGLRVLSQTYFAGAWRADGEFSQMRTPSSAELDLRMEELRKEEQAQRARLEELRAEHKDKLARYQRLTSNQSPAKMTIVSQKGDKGNADELQTTIRFEEIDDNGYPVPGKSHDLTVVGERLYFNALTVSFDDELIETGKVSGHPTLFRRIHGSSEAPAQGYQVNKFALKPADELRPQELEFLKKFCDTSDDKNPNWAAFWDFAKNPEKNPTILERYNEDREAFWAEFFEVGNEEVFWELSNDTSGAKEVLGLRSLHGSGPVIKLTDVEPGWEYTLRRRNLGSLEISFPDKSKVTRPTG